MPYYWDYNTTNDTLGIAYMIFIVVAVVIGSLVTIWYLKRDLGGAQKPEDALDLLKKRYARGEIDKKEFKEKKKDLTG